MEYTINSMAKLSGVSTRTLRYYDQIDLLKPVRINTNKYRMYGQGEVDKLQQILFYKELGLSLLEIKIILENSDFNYEKAMGDHLIKLENKKKQIEVLIDNVKKTVSSIRGEKVMSDKEKFIGFKDKLVKENEEKYGKELREKYGDSKIEESNKKLLDMSETQYNNLEELALTLNRKLKIAVESGEPSGELAQEVCDLHRQWLIFHWPKGMYTPEIHFNLAEMYCQDERFKEYYEKIAPKGAEFLKEAIKIYCGK